MRIQTFIKKCHTKGVFKMLSIYAVSSWVLLQLTAVTSIPLGLPEKSVTYLILILLIGFPLYIFYVWKRHVVPSYNIDTIDEEELLGKSSFHKIYFSSLTVITTICLVAVFLIIDKNFKSPTTEIATVSYTDKIAVLQFGNNTGDPSFDIVSKMASDWIMHGITKNNAGQVISSQVITDYTNALLIKNSSGDEMSSAIEFLKPKKIITGNFFLKNNKLLFQSIIKDGSNNKTLIAFNTNECNKNDALDCIDDLKESILGFLLIENQSLKTLEEIPKYDAYKYVLEAKNTLDDEQHIALLNKAIDSDPNYFEPKALRIAFYYNLGDYFKADSLIKNLKPDSQTNKRQLNILETYKALLAGNNRRVFNTVMEEYAIAPFDLQSNKSAMAVALQFVNRPEKVASIYNAIPMDDFDILSCGDCLLRLYVKSLANVELKNYSLVIREIEPILEKSDVSLLQKPLIASYVRSDKHQEVASFVDKFQVLDQIGTFTELCLFTANEYMLMQNHSKANAYLDKVLNVSNTSENINAMAQAYYFKQDYKQAVKLLEIIRESDSENIDILTKLAISYFYLNNTSKANHYLETLNSLRRHFNYGVIDYALARFYAANEDSSLVEIHLRRAIADGHIFKNTDFHNDPHFTKYQSAPFFYDILTYWH